MKDRISDDKEQNRIDVQIKLIGNLQYGKKKIN